MMLATLKTFLGDYTSRKFWKYALRWETSSLILAPMMYIPGLPNWAKVVLANFVGAVVFFKIDKRIFRHKHISATPAGVGPERQA